MQGFPGGSAGKESACNAGDPGSNSWVRKAPWRRDRLPTPVSLGFPCGSAGKESACNVGNLGLKPEDKKTIPAVKVALGNWLACYRVGNRVGIFT